MTAVDQQPPDAAAPPSTTGASTATGPTARSVGRSARGPLLALAALVAAGVLVGLVTAAAGSGGRLDPDSPSPSGARAVAQVLRAAGVEVRRVDTVDAVERAVQQAGADDVTVVVPVPDALAPSELERLGALPAGLLVVGADDDQLASLELPAETRGTPPVEERSPACDLPAAVTAGDVDLGGTTYRATSDSATGCYAVGGEASLLALPEDDAVLLGDGAPLTNDRLDDRGNAALALALLSERPGGVVWLVPRPGRDVPVERTLADLVPDAVVLGALQLLLAAGVAALWRARRLGRVVEEPLPVVVRAAEAVEGRGRLYRAAGARPAAAEALRSATRDRVARRVGAATGRERSELVPLVAARTGDQPELVDALLYGGPPADDAALVRLADDLHALETALSSTT